MGLVLLLGCSSAWAQWSANPGDTVRNGFGPEKGTQASVCRGACGAGCPSSCGQEFRYECRGDGSLTRVRRYECGTHQGCREHDDCLDRCINEQAEGFDCAAYCHSEAVETWGLETAISWAAGGGPFDGESIVFDYTMESPGSSEATYTCPAGSRRQCLSEEGYCEGDDGVVDPVFRQFKGGMGSSFQVSGFRSGEICRSGRSSSVCQVTVDIPVTGEEQCEQQGGSVACTRFGFEMDYRGAVPGEPIYCLSTGTDQDFLGSIVGRGIQSRSGKGSTEDGAIPKEFSQIFDQLGQEMDQGKSLEGALSGITITTEDGQVIGGKPSSTAPRAGVPNEVALNGPSGHLLVDMFERHDAAPPGSTVEHHVTCRHQGVPVVETTFRLQFARADGSIDSGDGDCSCACSNRSSADELCAFFCEEEFAACGP